MFWCGESRCKYIVRRWLVNPWYVFRYEIVWGLMSNIPICCVLWYILTVYMCIFSRILVRMLWKLVDYDSIKVDEIVMNFMFGKDAWERFCKEEYYRCPLCRLTGRVAKVRWHSDCNLKKMERKNERRKKED